MPERRIKQRDRAVAARLGRMDAIIGPGGRPLTLDDLPPPETKRWVSRRKAEVVTAVRQGLLSLEDACRRYNLSMEEFLSWQRLIETRSEEHTSELQSLMRISYAVFCLKKKKAMNI